MLIQRFTVQLIYKVQSYKLPLLAFQALAKLGSDIQVAPWVYLSQKLK